jgi:hypothetical protein
MKKLYAVSVLCLLFASPLSWAETLNFDDQAVNTATPDLVAGGVNVSFTNFITIAKGSTAYGFGGAYGFNTAYNDTVNFSGNFLTDMNDATGLPFARAAFRPNGFVRSIRFDAPVSDVAMYIADVDASQGVWLNALDSNNNLLGTLNFSLAGGDGLLRYASFAGYSGISQIQIIGNDPIGIDNLSFTAPAIVTAVPEPETYAMMIAGLGLLGTMARRRKQQEPTV